MPTITATFHQALRYFFVGAIALFLQVVDDRALHGGSVATMSLTLHRTRGRN